MVLVIELNKKLALLSYIASSLLILLFAEPEAMLMYIGFLGYYPIIKALIEKIGRAVPEWIIKLLVFNTAVLLIYFIFAKAIGIPTEDYGILGKYGVYILLFLGNIVFAVYDFAISKMAIFYLNVIRPKIKNLL